MNLVKHLNKLVLPSALILAGLFFSQLQGLPPAAAVTYGDEMADASVQKPWVASIWFGKDINSNSDFICTGSLIAPDVVLTAAHCVAGIGVYSVQLRANQLDGDWLYIRADATWKSPRYDVKKIQNDLGLIHLEEPVTDFKPIPYAKKSQTSEIDKAKNFVIYGWGDDQNKESANFLRYSKLKQAKKEAISYYSSAQFNSITTIAAGRYIAAERVYSGACFGDSGGPLVSNIAGVETVVGITSYVANSCRSKVPSVFTKVSYYAGDIAAGMKLLQAKADANVKAAPTLLTQPSISGNPRAGGQVTCDMGLWSAGTLTTEVNWSSPGWTWGSIHSETQKVPSVLSRSYVWTCEVTATNLYGSSKAIATITVF